MPKKQLVLADYDEELKNINVYITCNHVPTLAFIGAQVQYQITELIAQEKTKQDLSNQPRVLTSDNGKAHKILDFVRKGMRR